MAKNTPFQRPLPRPFDPRRISPVHHCTRRQRQGGYGQSAVSGEV